MKVGLIFLALTGLSEDSFVTALNESSTLTERSVQIVQMSTCLENKAGLSW
jgi:hypothetical protein